MSTFKWIAQFHAEHLNCAWCTSIFRTRSSLTCAERHCCLQPVHAVRQAVNTRRSDPRQRRPADRVCGVDTAERSSGAGWLIVDVDWRRRLPECCSWPDTLVLCSPDTEGPWQPACTPRVQERWASGVGRGSALTRRAAAFRTCCKLPLLTTWSYTRSLGQKPYY